MIKFFLPNIVYNKNNLNLKMEASTFLKRKLKIIGRSSFKRRYRFNRIFKKKKFFKKLYKTYNLKKYNVYKNIRKLSVNYKDYKIFFFKKKYYFYKNNFNSGLIELPKYKNIRAFKLLRITNYFNYYTNFWKY